MACGVPSRPSKRLMAMDLRKGAYQKLVVNGIENRTPKVIVGIGNVYIFPTLPISCIAFDKGDRHCTAASRG